VPKVRDDLATASWIEGVEEGRRLLRAEEEGPCGRIKMTTCMACGKSLKKGVDYPRETTEIHGIVVTPETPILCWDPDACIKRARERRDLPGSVRKELFK